VCSEKLTIIVLFTDVLEVVCMNYAQKMSSISFSTPLNCNLINIKSQKNIENIRKKFHFNEILFNYIEYNEDIIDFNMLSKEYFKSDNFLFLNSNVPLDLIAIAEMLENMEKNTFGLSVAVPYLPYTRLAPKSPKDEGKRWTLSQTDKFKILTITAEPSYFMVQNFFEVWCFQKVFSRAHCSLRYLLALLISYVDDINIISTMPAQKYLTITNFLEIIKSIQLYSQILTDTDAQVNEKNLFQFAVVVLETIKILESQMQQSTFVALCRETIDKVLSLLSSEILLSLLHTPHIAGYATSYIFNGYLYHKLNIIPKDKLLLSIIVPVYNVKDYIRQCLDSIYSQKFPESSYEVIIIDDKSSDCSLDICREYEEGHANCRVIALSKNTPGGAGIPSNIGITYARGEYIGFVDSDDFIFSNMFEILLTNAYIHDADLSICSFKTFNEKMKTLHSAYDKINYERVLNSNYENPINDDIRNILLSISEVPWRKIYRRSYVENNSIAYAEGDFFFEDNPLHWYAVLSAKNIAMIEKEMIVHRFSRDGQTISSSNEQLIGFAIHAKTIYDFMQRTNNFDKYKFAFFRWAGNHARNSLPRLNRQFRDEYMQILKNNCKTFKMRHLFRYKITQNLSWKIALQDYLFLRGNYVVGKYIGTIWSYFAYIHKLSKYVKIHKIK
jgi:glycosyltransferase involved in cell wall biosynthesis